MKYSRNQINKAGNVIITSKDKNLVDEAIDTINDWRTNHLIPLNDLTYRIKALLNGYIINPFLVSQRLKRLTSIQYKLDLNPSMGLGGMQDIGGLRIVLNNVPDLEAFFLILKKNAIKGFTLEKINNYVNEPKSSGYRSIHLIYKYDSNNDIYNGLRIELQIRTKLQHNWATAIETAGLYTKTSLKSSQGDNNWLTFFRIVSSLFSIKEKLPILKDYEHIEMKELMKMCHILNQEKNFCNILKALRVTVKCIGEELLNYEYYIINIDFQQRSVAINPYKKKDKIDASEAYSNMEKHLEDNKNAVVFVSVESIKDLKSAYPSYFFDTSEFIEALEKISQNCERFNLI